MPTKIVQCSYTHTHTPSRTASVYAQGVCMPNNIELKIIYSKSVTTDTSQHSAG